ncbi:MAG: ABC transporter permease [Dehalococcoidales bacterium]|nr:MAG: ABC transporter permease [Dehalococcoidales bacterium]
MVRFIIIRLLQTVVALIGIAMLIFVLVRVSGDPALMLASATHTAEDIQQIRVNLGLDKSIPEQFWIFVTDVVQGDLGESLFKKKPVTEMIGAALPNSLRLIVPSWAVAMLGALLLGVLGATRRDGFLDNGVKFIAILGQALPGFWVAIVAVFIFSVTWQLLPTSGLGGIDHYVLPVCTLGFFVLPGMMRLVRSSMLDVLDSEYIKLARIKGLSERRIIWKHALRNAVIAPLTVAGMLFAMLITGAVIIETVFSWPGIGFIIVEGVLARDFPLVQAIVIMVASFVLGINLLVDISYAWIDPQIRYQRT